ncbi:hypothetical protein [Agrococcus terreus]|uniref:Leucine-rich repeat domain-containing protein n=1 Tax=Agrococcus terreus TaxID=574649 RepID=A0ABQ2KP10_9MICO|nr:hypothetical protein [Agrococcus terreus]GGN88653.1 hypothetical protein GCM10010968_24480 [Agrococcus terreus]
MSIFDLPLRTEEGPWTTEVVSRVSGSGLLATTLTRGVSSLSSIVAAPGLAQAVKEMNLLVGAKSRLDGIEAFENLRTLVISGPLRPQSASLPASVERYLGPIWSPLVRAPGLKNLDNYDSKFAFDELIVESPLEHLDLKRAKSLRSLPKLASPELLRTLRITDTRHLDLRGIRECTNLENLILGDIKMLTNWGELRSLPALKTLTLEWVAGVDTPATLIDLLHVRNGAIYESRAFPEALRLEARRRLGNRYDDSWLV